MKLQQAEAGFITDSACFFTIMMLFEHIFFTNGGYTENCNQDKEANTNARVTY